MSGTERRVCLFAQYHPRQRLRPPLLAYLRALRDCGYQVYVACSGDGTPPPEDVEALAVTGAELFTRPNGGLDFGAWQYLVAQGCADGADRVLLANDSVFGPFRPLGPIIDRMDARGPDVWGMIESRQRGWHLQSWFLQFTGAAFAAPEVRRVLAQPFAAMDKEAVIAEGELALGAALQREGLRCDALIRFADGTWSARRHRLNNMHLDWRHNLISRDMPFLKAELLRDNPMRLPWTPTWRDVIREAFDADPGEIEAYLFDYTGMSPSALGAPYPVPLRKLPVRLAIGYVLAAHDHMLALRSMRLRQLTLRYRWAKD